MGSVVQNVANGGHDYGTAHGANLDYTLNLEPMRMA
jgi:hypothetical protein